MTIEEQLNNKYGFDNSICKYLNTLVNDVYEVKTGSGHFALKLYNSKSRNSQEVQWEIDLILHLSKNQVPVAKLVRSKNGYLQSVNLDGEQRTAVLFEWANGEKPTAELSTYTLLGQVAAQIHKASDSFKTELPREKLDIKVLIDDQLESIKVPLTESGQWQKVYDLCNRLRNKLSRLNLDWGVCHMDLTLDNIHRKDDSLIVFDFDSACESWRAIEPWGVLRSSSEKFEAWLKGYRSIRSFSDDDEKAVAIFGVIEDIRNVVWMLGYAKTSKGKPMMNTSELPKKVDEWLIWEKSNILKV